MPLNFILASGRAKWWRRGFLGLGGSRNALISALRNQAPPTSCKN